MRCDRCGKFCKDLYPVYCNPSQGGIDHEVCDKCRNGGRPVTARERVARREGQAEAWDECATESGERGWMHDYAVTEMQERNPYREEGGHVQ